MKTTKQEALDYHSVGRKGKVEVTPTKPCITQRDLSLAYTPGVAQPCLEIEKNPMLAYEYTAKGNLVAVVSNGTAVLGLGDIGAVAGKPVMEGKGVLFKRFADIDVFDIELGSHDPEEIIRAVQLLEPTFGGINLEDIKAPECFYIEDKLKATMNIPVFHDDQHGTAIISGAALLNAVELSGKKLSEVKIVVSGAGASAISCSRLYVKLGASIENITLCDSKGVVYKGRAEGMNKFKEEFAKDTPNRTLADAMKGADVFIGLSKGNVLSKEVVATMAPNCIVFAMANPDPEITYEDATSVRDDIIMATGRSDYPNQINNVLGFPFIFRGALDVQATAINDEMKLAASRALAALAKEEVPDSVRNAYEGEEIVYGKDYIVPKPFDTRVLTWVAPAVAKAAMETGVARKPIEDFEVYKEQLLDRLGVSHEIVRRTIHAAQRVKTGVIVFSEGQNAKIQRAAQIVHDMDIAHPILLGDPDEILPMMEERNIDSSGIKIISPEKWEKTKTYVDEFHKLRQRKGITHEEARRLLTRHRHRNYFAAMMVRMGDADAMISGLTAHYPETIRPALEVLDLQPGVKRASGMYILIIKGKVYFLADTTLNFDPTAEELAEIAVLSAQTAKRFDIEPRVAMLSFSNFGSAPHPSSNKVRKAVELIKQQAPGLIVDGEMQADTATVPAILQELYPFSKLQARANVLIFPNLDSGNIAYKLLQRIGGADVVGPILNGLSKPVYVLQRNSEVDDVVNMAAFAMVEARQKPRV
ncbi:MAG: NADP-dependent malic enzyme [Ignavibacteriales bacterium]|nr:MAG: NADP-dependent malic enzyme [Ignavibacteriaceae bacterium]MBW7873240.1 NADP-dependent malic enzyme [Ignavibacteria bacterium]MCZ2142978.1 NADP-dependent malic enzyme [Ignavibacteriales bacterium]OQY73117.1 MAG: NADP-dependent malic enzyme [Ignavibacteriales bacterium UTCHB3]MBV6444666.1 NADP-dependent malic enzyme [Ignavibacteriaceae bacterium]